MIKIISERHREFKTSFELCFDLKGEPAGNGYAFPLFKGSTKVIPCKEDMETLEYIPCAEEECPWWENYIKVKDDRENYEEPYIHKDSYSWIEPAKAICYCGNEIYLDDEYMGACECPHCGRWYNMFGQELNRPEMWEVE